MAHWWMSLANHATRFALSAFGLGNVPNWHARQIDVRESPTMRDTSFAFKKIRSLVSSLIIAIPPVTAASSAGIFVSGSVRKKT